MLCPGERAVVVLGGAKVRGWRLGCCGACELQRSSAPLWLGGAGGAESARARAELPAPAAPLLAPSNVAPESPA